MEPSTLPEAIERIRSLEAKVQQLQKENQDLKKTPAAANTTNTRSIPSSFTATPNGKLRQGNQIVDIVINTFETGLEAARYFIDNFNSLHSRILRLAQTATSRTRQTSPRIK
jgi:hypothetical protein